MDPLTLNGVGMTRSLLFTLLISLVAHEAWGHQYWIEPTRFSLASGDRLTADFVVGHGFRGDPLGYVPARTRRFVLEGPGETLDLAGPRPRSPAVSHFVTGTGLAAVTFHSTPTRHNWKSFAAFTAFLDEHDNGATRDAHLARGLPISGFTEIFSRSAKTLLRVGDASGADEPGGLPLEFVLEADPYDLDPEAPLAARLLWEEEPWANARVDAARRRPDGQVDSWILHTDAAGRFALPTGRGAWMLGAVRMTEPTLEEVADTGALWHSVWGSLTFAREGEPGIGDAQ